jgi:hypothetical protein
LAKRAVYGIFVKPRYTHLINAAAPGDAHDRHGHHFHFVSRFFPRFVRRHVLKP